MANKLKTVGAREPISKGISIDLENSKTTSIVTCKNAADAATKTVHEWCYDFSKVSQGEILKLATASLNITMQRKFREAVKAGEDWDNEDSWGKITFDVADILAETKRQSKTTVERAETLIAKLSDAERERLLAQLTKAA